MSDFVAFSKAENFFRLIDISTEGRISIRKTKDIYRPIFSTYLLKSMSIHIILTIKTLTNEIIRVLYTGQGNVLYTGQCPEHRTMSYIQDSVLYTGHWSIYWTVSCIHLWVPGRNIQVYRYYIPTQNQTRIY